MPTGREGDYRWLETERELEGLIELCPELIQSKYPVVTSFDSGPFRLSPGDRLRGWTESGEIAYGPAGASIATAGYDEWYVFENPPLQLGVMCRDNVFER